MYDEMCYEAVNDITLHCIRRRLYCMSAEHTQCLRNLREINHCLPCSVVKNQSHRCHAKATQHSSPSHKARSLDSSSHSHLPYRESDSRETRLRVTGRCRLRKGLFGALRRLTRPRCRTSCRVARALPSWFVPSAVLRRFVPGVEIGVCVHVCGGRWEG